MDSGSAKIVLADERRLFREAVRAVLESEPDWSVVAEAANEHQVLSAAERARPDIIVLSATLSGRGRLALVTAIEARARSKIVLLLDRPDTAFALLALEAGVVGLLGRETPLARLLDALRSVRRDGVVVPPRLLASILRELLTRRRQRDYALWALGKLTPRQREVLALLAQGVRNEGIAAALGISPETARTHVHNLLGKMQFKSRVEAATFVLHNDLLGILEEGVSSAERTTGRVVDLTNPPYVGSAPVAPGVGNGGSNT